MSSFAPFGVIGRKKAQLEAVGIVFEKVDGAAWVALFEGETIASSRLLADCVNFAEIAVGGL